MRFIGIDLPCAENTKTSVLLLERVNKIQHPLVSETNVFFSHLVQQGAIAESGL
jgi:hypothetical protein